MEATVGGKREQRDSELTGVHYGFPYAIMVHSFQRRDRPLSIPVRGNPHDEDFESPARIGIVLRVRCMSGKWLTYELVDLLPVGEF